MAGRTGGHIGLEADRRLAAQLANISDGEVRTYLKSASRSKRAATAVHAVAAPGQPAAAARGALARDGCPQSQVAGGSAENATFAY
jgi:hypothetical protein